MVDFKKLISPQTRARMKAERVEIRRLFALPDRWLAQEILKLSRKAREEAPDHYKDPTGTYSTGYVWNLMPEIARRLGAQISPNESVDPDIRFADGPGLRRIAGFYVGFTDFRQIGTPHRKANPEILFNAHNLLARMPVHGNPMTIALDRVCPPDPAGTYNDATDRIANHIREVAKARGTTLTGAWTPYMDEEYETQRAAELETLRRETQDDVRIEVFEAEQDQPAAGRPDPRQEEVPHQGEDLAPSM